MESNKRGGRKRPRSNSTNSGSTRQIKYRKKDKKCPQKLSRNYSNKPRRYAIRKSCSKNGRIENRKRGCCKHSDNSCINGVKCGDSKKILLGHDIYNIAQLEETEVVMNVFKKLKAFQELLDEEHLIKKPEVLCNVLTILEKAIAVVEKSRHSKNCDALQQANRVIGEVLNGHSKFEFHLKLYLDSVEKEKLLGICCLFCKLLTINPSKSVHILPIADMKRAINQHDPNNESSRQKVDEMMTIYEKAKEKPASSERNKNVYDDNREYQELPIIPQWTEVSASKSLTRRCLRPNIINGSYDNWFHYFDIHFRLLREDFVAPLRKGVQDYLKGLRGRELSNIKVYTNVYLVNIKFSMSGVYYQVNIGKRPRGSKRLIYGSLVCLSHDGFQENSFFGTVENCDGIDKGVIGVKFCDAVVSCTLLQYIMTKSFVMVESCAYYEAYRPILQSLRDSDGNSMPFTKYLIDVSSADVSKPQYLVGNPDVTYDLSHLLSDKGDDKETDANIEQFSKVKDVSDITSWTPSLLNLDKSQIEALRNGLTQELSVIQGPPGTGKTYIGLKLVETLLKNKENWNSTDMFGCKSPILVMCYTNHALDQFLEGILDCSVYKEADGSINLLRIGSRTKSERLAELSIQNKRKTINIPLHRLQNSEISFSDIKESQFIYQEWWDKFKLSLITIVPLQQLWKFLDPNHDYFFFHGKLSHEKKFLLWLLPDDFFIPPAGCVQVSNDKFSNQQLHSTSGNVTHSAGSQGAAAELPEEHRDTNFGVDHYLLGIDHEDDDIYYYVPRRRKPAEKVKFESIIPAILRLQMRFVTREMIKKFMTYLSTVNPMSEDEALEQIDLNSLKWPERIKLYKYWVVKYQKYYAEQCSENFEKYNSSCTDMSSMRKVTDRYVIETASVIGMTTTCAARYKDILQKVKPKIIIVEEAAEVLESHIVSALNNGTHHLVLIGDHKQLRPKPNEYDLETKFNLGISLFERLIRNGHPHVTLNIQHRMRPEISQLVNSHIYDNILKNHPSVEEHPNVRGVKSNLFFIDHHQPESEDDSDCSHSNEHEADFLIALCRYLLQQNYSPSQITILVTYSGQLRKMRQKIKEPIIKEQEPILTEVRISTVDDFQGEENDIILLSLVRSNEEHNIGFLKEDNRVCVALSRARQGFYCIGNFKLLRDSSLLWDSIIIDLESKEMVGTKLTLQCHNHPEVTFEACNHNDFTKNSPYGGCHKKCTFRLPCGHVCEETCHSSDPKHKSYLCKKKCNKVCQKGHPCVLKCHRDDCGPCMQDIVVKLSCGHEKDIKCSTDPNKVFCNAPCQKKCLARDHLCKKKCFEDCGDCKVKIPQIMTECKHKVDLPCYIPPLHKNCPEPCTKTLPCGHRCALKCGQDCSSEVCREEIEIELPCKHLTAIPCGKSGSSDIQCNKPCDRKLNCTHACTKQCNEPCLQKCMVLVFKDYPCKHKQDNCYKESCTEPCEKKLNCGHTCRKLCGEPCVEICKELCEEVLACGHECQGRCHSCKSSGVHKLCQFKVHMKRFCGHQQTVSCAGLNDRGCTKSHEIPCSHGVQVIYCEDSLPFHAICPQPCMWQCRHFKCHQRCFHMCHRPQCNKPCPNKLNCGHKCPGLCGEPCLELCPRCDHEQFLNQLKCPDCKTLTYYRLPCGHIFTVEYLDNYTQNSPQLVSGPLVCPHKPCGKPMSTCYRYGNIAKHYLERAQQVKYRINNNPQLFEELLLSQLEKFNKSALVNGRLHNLQSSKTQNNLPDKLYLAMLLARIVNTAELVNDSSSNIRNELENQIKKLLALSHTASLSFTAVQNLEQKYLFHCLEVQIYLAKKSCRQSGVISIDKAEAFLKVLTGKSIKVEITMEKFHKFSEALAKDFPETVSHNFNNYLSTVVLQYPFLQKGLWWHCTAQNHYYCTPASISCITRRNCPECADCFLGYVEFSRNTTNQLQIQAASLAGSNGAEAKKICLKNAERLTTSVNSHRQIEHRVYPELCSTSRYNHNPKTVSQHTGRNTGGTSHRLSILHRLGPTNGHQKRKSLAEELEDGKIDKDTMSEHACQPAEELEDGEIDEDTMSEHRRLPAEELEDGEIDEDTMSEHACLPAEELEDGEIDEDTMSEHARLPAEELEDGEIDEDTMSEHAHQPAEELEDGEINEKSLSVHARLGPPVIGNLKNYRRKHETNNDDLFPHIGRRAQKRPRLG